MPLVTALLTLVLEEKHVVEIYRYKKEDPFAVAKQSPRQLQLLEEHILSVCRSGDAPGSSPS
jgi:hypothetical protein